jgi:chitodextrinase
MTGIPLSNGAYQDLVATTSDANLRVVGQKDLTDGNAHLWIQNKSHTWTNVVNGVNIPPLSGTVRIGGFEPGQSYTLEWWNTYLTTGQVTSTQSVSAGSDGVVTVPVNALTTDAAVKIRKEGSAPAPSPDAIAPSAPTGLTIAAVSSSEISLSWTASTDNVRVIGYKVFRGANQIASTVFPSFIDTRLSPSTTYTYSVTAYDQAGNSSASSTPVSATTTSSVPVVSLLVTDANGAEPGTDVGRFQITRSGSPSNSLIVLLTAWGTAGAGSDYATLPASVTIPAGFDLSRNRHKACQRQRGGRQ